MSDVSKSGPLGEGEESRPLKVDLTRIDIRRGTLNLPRRFYDTLPQGELEAADTVAGHKLTVTFRPPREIEGLAPFFEEHDLQPNDAVMISLAGGLQLTPLRRERRQGSVDRESQAAAWAQSPAQYETPSPSPESGRIQVRENRDVPGRHSGQPTGEDTNWDEERSRVRLKAQIEPEDRIRSEEPSRVRLKAQAPAAYLAPPVPDTKGGWQDVLHDPAPRRGPTLRPSERAVMHPDEQRTASASEREESSGSRAGREQQGLFDERSGQYGVVREATRERAAQPGRGAPSSEKPLASHQESRQSQSDDRGGRPLAPSREGMDSRRGGGGEESQPRPPREVPSKGPQPPARVEKQEDQEREPVLVGASAAEGDVAGRISRYLQDPGTPAIVRAGAVAEELRLPLDAVQEGLAQVSRNSDGAVSAIRPDVYLVKRSR